MVLLASDFDKSKYLKAGDLEREKKFRIKIATEEVIGTGDNKEKKLVVWFTNDERGLVLNKTNNRTIRGDYGDDVAGWAGKIIIVFPTMVPMGGKMVPALRLRIPPPKQAAGNGQTAKPKRKPPVVDDELDDEPPAKPAIDDDLNDEINF